MANVLRAGVTVSREAAAHLMGARNRKWQQIGRGRRDSRQIETQQKEPNMPGLTRVADDQRRGSVTRGSDRGRKEKPLSEYGERTRQGRGGSGRGTAKEDGD